MSLIEKNVAMYFSPEAIGSADGPRGICGLYVNGTPWGHAIPINPSHKVTKEESGYSEAGPRHCANCDEMIVRKVYGTSP